MTSRQERFPVAASRFRFAHHGRQRGDRERALAAHGQGRGRAVLHQVDAHRGDQPRPGRHVLPDRGPARGPAQHRVMAGVRAGQREPGPAGLRRPGIAGDRQPQRSAPLRSALGQRVPAHQVPGDQVPRLGRPGPLPLESRRDSTPRAAGGCSTTWPASTRSSIARSAIPRSRRGSLSTSWPTRMQASVPELTDLSTEPASIVRALRTRGPQAGDLRGQLPAGPPARRARRAVHPALPSRLGPARPPARRRSPASAATPTSPPPALITDLKQRGLLDDTLVIWGGEFGRTVYCQGTLTAERLRPRPPSPLLHDLAGRAAASSRGSLTARPTISATTSSRTRCTSTTCTPRFSTAWESTTPG